MHRNGTNGLLDNPHCWRPTPADLLDFVASARQDIPRLVAEIRRLRAHRRHSITALLQRSETTTHNDRSHLTPARSG